MKQNKKIPNFKPIKIMGSGTFGYVFQALNLDTN